METPIKGFKGFDKDLKCRGLQYEVGTTYETDKAVLCESGFHFVQNPHDIFQYYSPGESRFAIVEALAPCQGHGDDSKLCTTKIKIDSEISVFNICKIAVSAFFATFKFSDKIKDAATNNAGDWGAANAGDWGAANAGNRGAASVGKRGVAIVATEGKARGDIGSILVLVNRDDNGDVVKYIAAHVDGKTIKANIYYKLDNGKLMETD